MLGPSTRLLAEQPKAQFPSVQPSFTMVSVMPTKSHPDSAPRTAGKQASHQLEEGKVPILSTLLSKSPVLRRADIILTKDPKLFCVLRKKNQPFVNGPSCWQAESVGVPSSKSSSFCCVCHGVFSSAGGRGECRAQEVRNQ